MQTTPQQPQRQFRPSGPTTFGPANTGQTPSQRATMGDGPNMPGSRSGVSGYGMSAGMKVGRQQGRPRSHNVNMIKGDLANSIHTTAPRPDPPIQPTAQSFRQRLGPNQ